MVLKKEEVRQIFANYIGQQAIFPDGKTCEITGILLGADDDVFLFDDSSKYSLLHTQYKLMLTPLEQITEEHIKGLAKIFSSNPDNVWDVKYYPDFIVVECKDRRLFIYFNSDRLLDFEMKQINGEWTSSPLNNLVDAIDQLREWGYALPYKGGSLFETATVVDKTTIKKTE